jgi:hypothetical protein
VKPASIVWMSTIVTMEPVKVAVIIARRFSKFGNSININIEALVDR